MKLARFNYKPIYQALPALAVMMLTGCFGGTMAQQFARSILMHGADKATTAAVDAHERSEKLAAQNMVIKKTALDEYDIAFLRSGFEVIQPKVEVLPVNIDSPPSTPYSMQVSKLVSVEVWSMLIGEEKLHLLEKARLKGSPVIPPKEEWSRWQVAIGATEQAKSSKQQEPITFLIPPDIGKMRSGAKALVELPDNGDLSIVRYALN